MTSESITPANRLVYEHKKSVEDRCLRLQKAITAGGGNGNVAKATGIPKATLSTYACGRDMKASAAVAIANACGVSVDWLFTGNGSMLSYDMRRQQNNDLLNEGAELTHDVKKRQEFQERATRLKFAVQRAGGTKNIAAKTAISPDVLERFMEGEEPSFNNIATLAEACSVSIDWLIRGKELSSSHPLQAFTDTTYSVDRRRSVIKDDTLEIPFFQTEVAAGNGIIAGKLDDSEKIHLSKEFLKALLGYIPKDVLLMRTRGDSMYPTIQSQDVLLVSYDVTDLSPGIYVMAIGDMILIKRLDIKNPQTFEIISDNNAYSRFETPIDSVCWGNKVSGATVRIIGKVQGYLHFNH